MLKESTVDDARCNDDVRIVPNGIAQISSHRDKEGRVVESLFTLSKNLTYVGRIGSPIY